MLLTCTSNAGPHGTGKVEPKPPRKRSKPPNKRREIKKYETGNMTHSRIRDHWSLALEDM